MHVGEPAVLTLLDLLDGGCEEFAALQAINVAASMA
jgi:hypothetical protein